jgi:hypothetical protein
MDQLYFAVAYAVYEFSLKEKWFMLIIRCPFAPEGTTSAPFLFLSTRPWSWVALDSVPDLLAGKHAFSVSVAQVLFCVCVSVAQALLPHRNPFVPEF